MLKFVVLSFLSDRRKDARLRKCSLKHRISITHAPLDCVSMADRERFVVICMFPPTLDDLEETSQLRQLLEM